MKTTAFIVNDVSWMVSIHGF